MEVLSTTSPKTGQDIRKLRVDPFQLNSLTATKLQGTGWTNVEYRSFRFKDPEHDASLEETRQSQERRRGSEKPLTETERIEMKEAARKTFLGHEFEDEDGLIKRRW